MTFHIFVFSSFRFKLGDYDKYLYKISIKGMSKSTARLIVYDLPSTQDDLKIKGAVPLKPLFLLTILISHRGFLYLIEQKS